MVNVGSKLMGNGDQQKSQNKNVPHRQRINRVYALFDPRKGRYVKRRRF